MALRHIGTLTQQVVGFSRSLDIRRIAVQSVIVSNAFPFCVRGGRIGQHYFRIARRPFFAKVSQPGTQGWRRMSLLAIETSLSATGLGNLPRGDLIHALDRSWSP